MTPEEAYANASAHEKQLFEKYKRLGGSLNFSEWSDAGQPKKDPKND